MLTHHTLQTEGTCVGNNLRFSLGDLVGVTCPLVPANTTTALLAGAGIEPIYCSELSLQYGNINISGPYSYGTGIEYTCQTGFQLVGVSSQTCLSSGGWSHELPYCNVLNCTDPGVPSNGRRHGNHFTNGSLIQFICDNGFNLNGTSLIMCYRGNWSAPVPVCISNTPSPSSSSSSVPTTTSSSKIITSSSPSPSATNQTNDSMQFAYQFLSAIFIALVVLIILVLISALVFLCAYHKIKKTKKQ
ncbi:PREDICTED: C4b-binding protein beta chain-like [Amphimedon queenslandica]|uniref:Sushi domain-containing protein n=1 Tax=Amphimedon queenslandica TaxID=400682 RepID=A0AAN0JX49_AMPQE|nr:PREDICTED: C4b-binding protein beta chain-like [Amphimedon queenslandica]|eukprot:XP_019861479.1 PREDICTED: C4b-binding protein beta chain-like [Amphimedon queenslandica]